MQGSFGDLPKSTNFKNIKVGQILLLSKSGSWVPVDACNFFLQVSLIRPSLIRACTGSFGNVFGALKPWKYKSGDRPKSTNSNFCVVKKWVMGLMPVTGS